jgi:hypothetical protein
MLPDVLARDEVTIVAPAMIDDRGTMVPDWTLNPESCVVVSGCSVQPGDSSEDLAMRQNVSVRWTVWAPPDAPVTATSGVIFRGVLYAVAGEPEVWTDPLGRLSHKVARLEAWHG